MGLFDFLFGKKKEHERQMKQQILQEEQERRWREEERARREKLFPWEADMRRRAECAAEAKKAKESKVHSTGHLLFLKELVSDAFFAYRHVTNTSKYPTYIWAEKELYLGDESKIAYFVPFWWIRSLAKSNVQKFNETMDLLNNDFQINVQGFDVDEVVKRIRKNGFYQFQPGFDVNVNKGLISQFYKDSAGLLRIINLLGDNIDSTEIIQSQTKKFYITSISPAINEVINDMVEAFRNKDNESNVDESPNSTDSGTLNKVSTEVTDEDIANGIEDEFGVIYSKDGTRLIKAKKDVFEYYYAEKRGIYRIKEGTKIICDNAFNGTLTTTRINVPYIPGVITFPHSVIAIGNKAIKASAISKFDLPNSLLHIGDYAFAYSSLREITIPSKVSHLGKNPFSNCTCSINSESNGFVFKESCLYTSDFKKIICCIITNNIEHNKNTGWSYTHYKSIIIANSTEIIGAHAFDNCDISQITLPSSVRIIEEGAFANSELFDIHIPADVSVIEDNTFWHCINLEEVSLPNTIKEIGMHAFGSCIELTQINIPNSVQSIGDLAFAKCIKLKKITIPESVIHIGCGAFNRCGGGMLGGCDVCNIYCLSPNFIIKDHALYTKDMCKLISCYTIDNEFFIPNGVQIIGKYAFENLYLERIEIPNSVITIEPYGMTCSGLRYLIIPGNVKSIKDNAFEFSEIEEITVLEGVEEIGNKAFYHSHLRTIKLPQSIKTIGNDAFDECWGPKVIYIPEGTRSKFKELLPWYKNKLKEV